MDWSGIATAIADRERVRLGLPSRMEMEAMRAKQAQVAAESASGLETAEVNRGLLRAKAAALPAEQALETDKTRSEIARNLREPQPRAEASSLLERIMAMPPEEQKRALELNRQMRPPAAGEGREPRSGWQPQFDAATGVLKGYYHPATETFRAVGEGNIPAGISGNIPPGEREKRGALQSILSDVGRLRELAAGPAGEDIGYYSGRLAETRASGIVPGLGAPGDDTMEMFHISDNISDMLLRARSGAQINEQEYARLRKITPNARTSPEKFAVDLNRFEIELKNTLAGRQGLPITQTQGAPAPGAVAADPLEGRTATGPGGQKIVRKGGQWVPAQ